MIIPAGGICLIFAGIHKPYADIGQATPDGFGVDSGGVVCGVGGGRRDLHQHCRVFVRDICAVLSCILHDCHNISSLSRVRETAGSLENCAVSSNFKIVRPHLLTHR